LSTKYFTYSISEVFLDHLSLVGTFDKMCCLVVKIERRKPHKSATYKYSLFCPGARQVTAQVREEQRVNDVAWWRKTTQRWSGCSGFQLLEGLWTRVIWLEWETVWPAN